MDEGADGFEFDIFVTQDKVPVVIHRKGAEDIKIEQLTKAELDAFCLASENRIYTLEETLIFIADTNRARPMNKPIINAELKGDGVVVPTIKVLEAVEKKHPSLDQSQIIYDALEWDRVAEMKRLCPAANVMPALSTARLFNLATGEALTESHSYDPDVFKKLESFLKENSCCGIDVMTADIMPQMIDLAKRLNVGFCSYPQGPHPKSMADRIYANIGLLEEFSRSSQQPVILKVEDVTATFGLVEEYISAKPVSLDKIERMMGMTLS